MNKFEKIAQEENNIPREHFEVYEKIRERVDGIRKETRKKIWKKIGLGTLVGAGVGTGVGFLGALGVASFSPMLAVSTSSLGAKMMLGGGAVGTVAGSVNGYMSAQREKETDARFRKYESSQNQTMQSMNDVLEKLRKIENENNFLRGQLEATKKSSQKDNNGGEDNSQKIKENKDNQNNSNSESKPKPKPKDQSSS